jgi:hypothetical protein
MPSASRVRELGQKQVLCPIGILILVDVKISKSLLIA